MPHRVLLEAFLELELLLAVVIFESAGSGPPMKSAATLVVVLASLSRAAVGFATSAAPTPRARTTALRALDDPVEKLSVDAAVILSALTSQRLVDEIVFKNADLLAPIVASDFDVLPGLVSDAFAWFCCWLLRSRRGWWRRGGWWRRMK